MAADLNITLNGTPVPVYLGENAFLAAREASRAEAAAEAAEQHKLGAELARDQAGDLAGGNVFVAADLAAAQAAGEAGTTEGAVFRAIGEAEGQVSVRRRTSGGSDELYKETTTAALQSSAPGMGAFLIKYIAAGAGAIGRWVMDKLRERASILDYGAIAYATKEEALLGTSSQAAIMAALASERDVIVPDGWYQVDAIKVPSGRRLRGSFFGTSAFVQAPGVNDHVISNEHAMHPGSADNPEVSDEDIQVWDLLIDGNRDGHGNEGQYSGLELTWVKGFDVQRIKACNTRGHGVSVHGGYGRLSVGESWNFGDDGLSIADAGRTYTDGNMQYAEDIDFEHWYSHDANVASYATSGSGFEVDDGPRRVRGRYLLAERCINSVDVHWHNDPGKDLSELPRPSGDISFEYVTSRDPVLGHGSFLGHPRVIHSGLSLRGWRMFGRPSNPSSTSGALDITNGTWTNVFMEDMVMVDAGRCNLRGIEGGEISFIFNDAESRVDIGGQSLASGAVQTYTKNVFFPFIDIQAASTVLFERLDNVLFGLLKLKDIPFLRWTNFSGVTVQRLMLSATTNAARGMQIGGGTGSQSEIGLHILSGEIQDAAGTGIQIEPSATGVVKDILLHLNIRRSGRAALRFDVGQGGQIDGVEWNGVIEDSNEDESSPYNHHINVGGSTSKIRNVRLGGDILNVNGKSAYGVTVNQLSSDIEQIFYTHGDIAGSGTTADISDAARIMKVLPGVIGGHAFSVTAPAGGSTVDTEARAAIEDLIEVLEGRGLL